MPTTTNRTNASPTKVITGIVRLSYANVWEPKSINGNRGVACGLGNTQKIRDGEPLSGRTNAADYFTTNVDDDDFLS